MLIGRFKDNWSHGIGPLQDMSSRPPLSVEQQLRVTLKVFLENRIKPDSLLLRDPLHSPEGLWVTDVAGQRLHQRVFDI